MVVVYQLRVLSSVQLARASCEGYLATAQSVLHPIGILLDHDLHAPIRMIIVRLLRRPRHIVVVVSDTDVLDLFVRRVFDQAVNVDLFVFSLLFAQGNLTLIFL